jgi:hypothetical protein
MRPQAKHVKVRVKINEAGLLRTKTPLSHLQ